MFTDAAHWVQDIQTNAQGPTTVVQQKDVDDDPCNEYILKNNEVYLCFKRWGARLIYAFVYDPVMQDALVRRDLLHLIELGMIEPTGKGRSTKYVLKPGPSNLPIIYRYFWGIYR